MSSVQSVTDTNKETVVYDPHGLKTGRKEKVLDEESYIQDLEKIITRDFFPDLERLKVQSEYLDAVDKKDHARLRILHDKYSVLLQRDCGTPARSALGSPRTFDSDDDVERKSESGSAHNPQESDASQRSLDRYLANHTSEDNAAFREMICDLETRRRSRMAWCYEAEQKAKSELRLPEKEPQLAIMAPAAVSSASDSAGTASTSGKALAVPAESEEKERSSQPDSWPGYKVHNAVLFVPEGAPFSAAELARRQADVTARKICHANTHLPGLLPGEAAEESARLKEAILSAKAARTAAAQLQGRVGPDGRELFPAGATPGIRGFSFLAATPSPAPGRAGESPFITWGEVEGTPFALDEVRASPAPLPGGGFKIPDVPERDRVALELAERAHRRHREDKATAMRKLRGRLASPASSISSSSSSRAARLASLSPAALRLSSKIARPSSGSKRPPPSPLASPRTPGTPSCGLTAGLLNLTAKSRKK